MVGSTFKKIGVNHFLFGIAPLIDDKLRGKDHDNYIRPANLAHSDEMT